MTAPPDLYTADRVISDAYREAGLISKGQVPDPEDYANALVRLNHLIGAMQTKGLKLWVNRIYVLALTANQASYTFGPAGTLTTYKFERVLEGYYVQNSGLTSRPLTMLSWNGYNMLSSQSQTGQPNSFFTDKQQDNTVIKLWPVPDTSAASFGFCRFLVQVPINGPIKITDEMNFPAEWALPLIWGLADELTTGQPQEIIQRCATKAAYYMNLLENWDVEDASTSFAPDQRAGWGPSWR